MLTRGPAARRAGGSALDLGASLPRKFFTRGSLLRRWVYRIVLPAYWKPLLGAMILMTAGTLAEAASFIVAAQMLIHWATFEHELPALADSPLLIGGSVLVVLLGAGALCGYYGYRMAIRAVLAFETSAFGHAVGIARDLKKRGMELDAIQNKELVASAPRFMGRTVLQCVGLGSSLLLALVGAVVCAFTFPVLSLILGLILVISSPVFFYNTLQATRVGHRMRETAVPYSTAKKSLSSKWLVEEHFDRESMTGEVLSNPDYVGFLDAFGDRLMISPLSRLLVNATLAVCIVASLMWTTATLELDTQTISHLVIFLVFLRVFFSGAKAIITAIQMIASFVPYFLVFLRLDPRMEAVPDLAADTAGAQAEGSS